MAKAQISLTILFDDFEIPDDLDNDYAKESYIRTQAAEYLGIDERCINDCEWEYTDFWRKINDNK